MFSSSDLLVELKKQREEKKKAEREQANYLEKESMQPLKQLQQSNRETMKSAQSVGDAILGGLIAGLGEGVVRNLCEMDYANKWLDWVQQSTDYYAQQQIQQNRVGDFFEKNSGVLGELASKIQGLRPEEAKNMLRPFYEQMRNEVGFNIGELVDVNTSNGNVTFKQEDGRMGQYSLYDMYPQLKEKMIYDQSMKALNDPLSDENIIKTREKEYNDQQLMAQQELNETQRHHRTMEGLESAKLRASMTPQMTPEEADYRQLYDYQMKNLGSTNERYQKAIEEEEDKKQDYENAMTTLRDLNSLHKEFEKLNLAGIDNPTIIGNIARNIYTGLNIGDKAKQLQGIMQSVNAVSAQFYNKGSRLEILGTGTQTKEDMEIYQKAMVAKFLQPAESWDREFKTRMKTNIRNYEQVKERMQKYQNRQQNLYKTFSQFKQERNNGNNDIR